MRIWRSHNRIILMMGVPVSRKKFYMLNGQHELIHGGLTCWGGFIKRNHGSRATFSQLLFQLCVCRYDFWLVTNQECFIRLSHNCKLEGWLWLVFYLLRCNDTPRQEIINLLLKQGVVWMIFVCKGRRTTIHGISVFYHNLNINQNQAGIGHMLLKSGQYRSGSHPLRHHGGIDVTETVKWMLSFDNIKGVLVFMS